MPTRLKFDEIRSLTFYKDAETESRRNQYIPQLNCIGKPCKLYTPQVVRCQNAGGSGVDVDWKCEADLPESFRFGRVEVSCEGWNGPGDTYVLKGSCSLDYHLVQIPPELRGGAAEYHETKPFDLAGTLFMILWLSVLAFILYSFWKSCRRGGQSVGGRGPPAYGPGGSRSFPGHFGNDDSDRPPPPYSKNTYGASAQGAQGGWRPGFWTGVAGTYLLNNLWRNNTRRPDEYQQRRMYDWERERSHDRLRQPQTSWFRSRNVEDRGEGSSRSGGLGSMRSGTGLGGSKVR